MIEKCIAAIEKQQNGKENTAVFVVGEQLKEIIKNTDGAAELVLQDLDVPEMSLENCEKKIKALADKKHRENKGNFAFVSPAEAEEIICKFYGITKTEKKEVKQVKHNDIIDLDNFF